MGDAPEELTVDQVVATEAWAGKEGPMATDEILFSGDGRTWKIHRPAGDPAPEVGATLRGWKKPDKGSFKIAAERSQNGGERRSTTSTGSTGRDDATGISIERQKSADIAKDMAVATASGDPVKMEANFEHYFDVVLAKIRPAADAASS